MDDNEQAFRATGYQTVSAAKHLAIRSVSRTDTKLRELLRSALVSRDPTVYPFVLKYAFCRRESDGEKILPIGAALHLLQQSSLLTDDVFDSGELRYNTQPVYLSYDVNHTIIAAELLQAIAFRCISNELSKKYFHHGYIAFRLLNEILLDGYTGQYLDLDNSSRQNITIKQYYRMISLGAGRVFQKIAFCGALLADKPREEIRILSRFAYAYGMALFILDDIIDLLPSRITRKTYASDLKQRRMRLPIILALKLGNRNQRRLLGSFLQTREVRTGAIGEATDVIQACGAFQASLEIANQYAAHSLRILKTLPPNITTKRFRWMAERLLVTA